MLTNEDVRDFSRTVKAIARSRDRRQMDCLLDASDLEQDIWLALIKARTDGMSIPLVGTVARRATMDRAKYSRRRGSYGRPYCELMDAHSVCSNSDRNMQASIAFAKLMDLPKKSRDAAIQFYRFGFTEGEIAKNLGISISTAQSRISWAIIKVRSQLAA